MGAPEDLRNIRDNFRTGMFGQREVWERQLDSAADEIERLEAALKQIVARQDDLATKVDRNSFESGYRQGIDQCTFIAEEALGNEQSTAKTEG